MSKTKIERWKNGMYKDPWNKGKSVRLSPASEFKKGSIPWNKNKKGILLHENCKKGWFKKGRKSTNLLPVGSIQIRVNIKRKSKRKWIKIAEPNKWMLNARYQWKKYYGDEFKKDCIIHHIDRDTLNDDPSNLIQLTRQEHINEHRSDLKT